MDEEAIAMGLPSERGQPRVGTSKFQGIPSIRRKVRHLWDGGSHRFTIYFATLDWATSKPSLSSSSRAARSSPLTF